MKKKIFIAAAVIFSSSVKAQESADSIRNLPDVSITANKYPAKTSLTGKVVGVITRQQLESAGGKDLAQVLTEQTGLYINGANSNAGKDKAVYLRGARSEHTLIMLDGVPLYDPSGIGSNFDIRYISVDQVERIEILKGSQSTLYGTDAIAGVINIITRKAPAKPIAFNSLLSFGSYNTVNGSASVYGKANKWDFTLQYAVQSEKGINEATDTIKMKPTDRDGFDRHSVYASIGFTPVSSIRIQPYFRYSLMHSKYDQGAFTDELDLENKSENIQTGIKSEIHFGKSMLNFTYNFSTIKRIYTDDSVQSRNGFAIYSKGDYRGQEHFADAFLLLPITAFLKLTYGIDFRRSTSDQTYNSISVFGPYKSEYGKDSLKQDQLGIYTALTANCKNGINAEVGGRYTHHSAYGSNMVFNLNPSYLWKQKMKVFANLSSAFRSPSLYQLYSEYGNRKLDPEKAISFEAGVQFFAFKKTLNVRATYFNRRVKDAIYFYTDPNTYQSIYINQDKQNDQGIELELSAQPVKPLMLKVFYSYVDGKISTKQNNKDTSFFNLTRRPRSSFGFNLAWQVNGSVSVHTGLTVTGKRTDITYDAFYNPVTVNLKGYVLLNLYAEYAFMKKRLTVFTGLRNLTNTRYTEVYGFNTLGFNATGGLRCNL